MQITRQADYAIRAVRYLARFYKSESDRNLPGRSGKEENERIATRIVAREMKIPPSFLAKIISSLSVQKIKVLETSRGANGGVRLARDPEQITLLEVVEAIDGPILLNECVGDPESCSFTDDCPIHPIWEQTQKELVDRLRATTFATLK